MALNFVVAAFRKQNKKYSAYDCSKKNGPHDKIPSKKESIRTLEFTLRSSYYTIMTNIKNDGLRRINTNAICLNILYFFADLFSIEDCGFSDS